MDPTKVDGVLSWPTPRSIKDLRGFLGLSGYYHSQTSHHYFKKRSTSHNEQPIFEKLKQEVCQAPILALPDFQEELTVETIACGQGIGVVLQQKGRPIAFFNKGLRVRPSALSIYNKEMLTVLLAVKKWHPYLVGKHLNIKIDHQSFRFLADRQAITPYQRKRVAKMLRYDYSITYKQRNLNIVADV
ncbi:polyprotein [Gossypium australe]|uniref:Polyprotein n=1 Tax=Gossypium australe TaxID=47621 RepID=A0A5B6WSA7_9ROSI|nr:polyprotein [Gossypium australe]